MIFSFRMALQYLLPRRRYLSSSLISYLSIGVITLVVWLVLLFFSVTKGMEETWISKLTSLYAPVRISPTKAYFDSYFYQVDAFASASRFSYKTLGEKNGDERTDPYDPLFDPELPSSIAQKSWTPLVQDLWNTLEEMQQDFPGTSFQDYEIGGALVRLHPSSSLSTISQMTYLLSLPTQNPHLQDILLPQEPLQPLPGRVGIFLPKSYQDAKVALGDTGTLSYQTLSPLGAQEHQIDIHVVGFYDPGFFPIGNKCLLVPSEVTRTIHKATQTFSPDGMPTNGIFVWPPHWKDAKAFQQALLQKLGPQSDYWEVDTFLDFGSAKELLAQFEGDKALLLLVASLLLGVACSNIFVLLLLLVQDKKKEIAILQAMGASRTEIGAIFGLAGLVIGCTSTCLGITLATITIEHLSTIVSWFTPLQGKLPLLTKSASLSLDSLLFVAIATPLLSLLAGVVPALQASRTDPSTILRGTR